MIALKEVGRHILGLFVDDGALAVSIVVLVAVAASASLVELPALYIGALLVFGTPLILCASVWLALRR
jgi:hypothetical protein